MAGTRAGKAIVPFEGDYSSLQNGARNAISGLGSHITNTVGGAFADVGRIGSAVFAGVSALAIGGLSKSILAAARVDELNITLDALAKSNNLSAASLHEAAAGVKSMGIETAVADQTIAKFVQSHLDISKASELARVAQDAAVISGQNSTDVTAQLIQGIQTQQVETLRNAGITIDGTTAMKEYAATLGISEKQMTAAQKQQAYLNAVLKQGVAIQGTYEAAMQSPSKMLRSFPRLFDDISISIGEGFTPALRNIISPLYNGVKSIDMMLQKGGPLKDFINSIGVKAADATKSFGPLVDKVVKMLTTADFSNIGSFFSGLSKFAPLLAGLGGAVGALGGANIPFIGQFLRINPILAAIMGVIAASPPLRAAVVDAVKALMPLVQKMSAAAIPLIQKLLAAVASALPTIVDLIQRVFVAAEPIVKVLIDTLVKLLPKLLPPLMQIVMIVGDTLVKVFEVLAPILAKILPILGDIIAQLATALVPVFEALAPLMVELAGIFGKVIEALMPILPMLARLIVEILPFVVLWIEGITKVLGFIEPAITAILKVLTNIISGISWFFDNLGTVKERLGDVAGKVLDWFKDLPNTLLTKLKETPQALIDGATWLISKMMEGLVLALVTFLTFFLNLPQRVVETITSVGPALVNIGISILDFLLNGLKVALPLGFKAFFVDIPVWLITKAIPFMAAGFLSLAGAFMGGFISGLGQLGAVLWEWFKGLPGALWKDIQNMGSALGGVFQQIGAWIWGKIKGGFGSIWDAIFGANGSNTTDPTSLYNADGSPKYTPAVRAEGGPTSGWTVVGERGRELVDFGRGGATVKTNAETEQLLGGHTYNINVYVQSNADAAEIAREIAWKMRTSA